MALPLLNTDGDVLGVLNLYSGEPAYFTRKRVRLFVIFANQVASAMENRMLIELEEQRNREIAEQLRQISRSHREWQLTFDSITDYVSIHDRNFRILKANKALARHLGKDQDSIVGTRCFELFHGTCVPLQACPHRTSMEESRVVVEEILEPRTSRTLRVSIFPYHSPEGDYIGSVHIARDITEEKEREMRLIMSERLASLGQMASGIAHEINNPLASIGGCAEGLLMKVKRGKYEPAQFEEYLTIIDEEVRRCKSITTGMLSFVRKTAYERKELDVNELLDKTVEIIGFQGRFRDVEVVREYQDGQPALFGSEGELRQVFLAVMTNALDAMEDAGTLTLTTRADAENAVIRIADTGPGISQEHLQRIFDPFFTTKSEKGGTGLGLSIAHKIVVNHEGAVSVRSECGRGTEFTIVLPLDKDRT
jgi:PAS domain S-box-containing protein